jgi:ABC-type nickel/cobalt efflux system permease component RcnA
MVAAYLVGSRGTARHAVILGAFVTVTHTIGVFALGIVALFLSRYLLPEDLFPWLNLVAAVMVLGVGLWLVRQRARPWWARRAHDRAHARGVPHEHSHSRAPAVAAAVPALATVGAPADTASDHHHHDYDHEHGHDGGHGHDHHHHHHGPGGHTHEPPDDLSMRSLLTVGATAGIVPCPSALVLLLGAIALERLGYGMVLVVAFSLGLALTLTAIGLMVIYAKRVLARVPVDGRLARAVPLASALVIVGLGVLLTVRALPDLL